MEYLKTIPLSIVTHPGGRRIKREFKQLSFFDGYPMETFYANLKKIPAKKAK